MPLDPPYISTVDSGNLAGHLIALSSACSEWNEAPLQDDRSPSRGSLTHYNWREKKLTDQRWAATTRTVTWHQLDDAIEKLTIDLRTREDTEHNSQRLADFAVRAETIADIPKHSHRERQGRGFRSGVLDGCGLSGRSEATGGISGRSQSVNSRGTSFCACKGGRGRWRSKWNTDFCSIEDRKLLSIGYLASEGSLDLNCYDLLASEARLASFLAIAKGDIPARHWFRLGRDGDTGRQRRSTDLLVGINVRISDAVAGDARARGKSSRANEPT